MGSSTTKDIEMISNPLKKHYTPFANLTPYRFRELSSFFFMAMCNNFGYTLLLTAARDILEDGGQFEPEANPEISRDCNLISTGTILLAASIPGLLIKSILPFFRLNTK